MKNRLIAILLLVTMFFTMFPSETMAVVGDQNNTEVNTVLERKNLKNPFTDVREGSWYYDAVQYGHTNGFFGGTSTNTFDPNGTMSRGMFVTILGRMAGVDEGAYKGQSNFKDVDEDAYYAPFVAWASKHGITAGIGHDNFNSNSLINREQMAVFFVRYFETFNVDYDTGANITSVPQDLDTVSPWAREMVLKLWKTGLLNGDGVRFNPTGKADRAQAATLCMRTDKVVEIWYKEPGVMSDRIRVEPDTEQKSETPNPPIEGNSSGGGNTGNSGGGGNTNNPGNPGGGSNTTYYNITFVIDDSNQEKNLYPKDTLLSTLPTPTPPSGKVFLGWYQNEEKTNPVSGEDRLTADTMLYAKFTEALALEEGGSPNFVSAIDQEPDFSIKVNKTGEMPTLGTDFKFRNITAPDKTPETMVEDEDEVNTETVIVTGSSGEWIISSESGGFTPGHTYQLELIGDSIIYDDSAEAFDHLRATNVYDIKEIRFFNFTIEQDGTLNLKLNDDIKYIGVDELNVADGASIMEYAGLYLASTDSQGLTTYTSNDGTGSFTYTGTDIQVGDTVSVYAGTKPTDRKPEKGTTDKTDNEDVSYVKITQIDGSTYYYVAAEAEDVLFTPDVLPIDVDTEELTGWSKSGTSVTVANNKLKFSDGYENMGLSAETTVDVGDFLAFYTGMFGEIGAVDQAYGEITGISVNGSNTTIEYKEATEVQVMSAMDLYDEKQLTEEELSAAIDENKDEIEKIIEAQLMESNFFDNAGEYLAGLALMTDEVKESFGDGVTLSDCMITYADGTPLGADDLALMGNIIGDEKDGKKPNVISLSISPRLSHFSQNLGGIGLRVEVAVSYSFKIQKSGSNTFMEVELTAFFEQEVTIGFSVSGGAVWKRAWIFPYIADFRMNGNLDLGTYTGIGITATAKLSQDKEPWGMPWPNSVKEADAAKKIFNLSESIKEKMEEFESVLPKGEASAGGGLADKYAQFMEDANEDWVDLITVNLIDLRGAVDPFHILAYGLQVDFVVSANLNVAMGMTFQYENLKRHSFSLSVKSKKADSDTVDLSTNGYQFDFYVMGTIGIRAGIRAKATVGLFSTKLAGIGLQIEAGAYARMWGYFYYHLENWKIDGKWQKESGYSGAVLIEVGAYLDVKFIAEALNGKYSYAPTIYANEWPFWSAGQRENVFDFAYKDKQTYEILNVSTYTLSSAVYDMFWMDLRTGKTVNEGLKDNIKNFDSNTKINEDDELYFAVEMSNPRFAYNPINNQITVDINPNVLEESCEMKITWKRPPLSGSSNILSRIITLKWSNDANAGTIAFESNGGSAVPMLRLIKGADISTKMPANPTRLGYTFAGWCTDKELNTSFTAATMPDGDTTLYAKWTPSTVGYTVEHYQKALDGRYVLTETTSATGTTEDQTNAASKSCDGFTAQNIKQQKIAPDGSTRVAIYYDRNLYDLTFEYGEGGKNIKTSIPYGSEIIKPSNPSKQGYTFNGWNATIPATMPINPLTFTAQWVAKTDTPYTVKHYKENLDTTYALEQVEGKSGTTGQSTDATQKNYTGFTAQAVTQKTIAANGSTTVEIYYNRSSHSLTWNVNGGNELTGDYTSGDTKYGTAIVKPTEPTRIGYSFGGWYKDAGFTMELNNNATMPDDTLTLYAKWDAAQVSYKLKHIRQNLDASYPTSGSLVETEDKFGITGQMTVASAKTYTGFTAQAVTQQTISADGSTVVVIEYARNSHGLTWDVNGGDVLTGSYTYGDTMYGTAINMPETPTRTGHTFIGWYKDTGLIVPLEENAVMPDTDLTLYAKWELIPENGYIVKHIRQSLDGNYDENASGLVEKQTLTGDVGAETSAVAGHYDGFTVQPFTQEIVSAPNITEVVIKYARNIHNLTWNVNDGEALVGDDYTKGSTMYGKPIVMPNTPTRTGYSFGGWYKDAGLNTLLEESATMPNEALTLYAKWTINTYTVSFDSNKGSGSSSPTSADSILRDHGDEYGILTPVSRDGYTFNGWYTAASGGTDVDNTGTVVSNHTLYARWTANNYLVVFNSNGGSGTMEDQSFTYDIAKNLSSNVFTRDGYTFNGWNTASNGTGTSYGNGQAVTNLAETGNVTLYAQWTPITYKVDFDSNAGSGSTNPTTHDNISVTYGNTYDILPTASREGYTFMGWYTAASGGTQVTNASTVATAENHMLYAQWTVNSYTVEFHTNGGDGTMGSQNFTYDGEQELSANEFSREGYIFKGWSIASDVNEISYQDKESVKNLINVANGTFNLYAQWEEDPSVAQIDDVKYETLQEAIAAVMDNETITLLRDSIGKITISHNNSFAIDLNGKTLNSEGDIAIWYDRGGVLTIEDTKGGGKITSTGDYTIRMDVGTLVIDGATVENHRTTGGSTLFTYGTGSMSITNATVIKTDKGDAIGISTGSTGGGNELNITNSTVSASDGRGIHANADNVKINLTGGSVTSLQTALRTTGASVEVHIGGGTVLTSEFVSEYYNGATIELLTAPELYINGGTIENTAENGNAIYNEDTAQIIISGSSIIRGKGMAMNTAPTLSGVGVTASTEYDGSDPVLNNLDNITNYKYLQFE